MSPPPQRERGVDPRRIVPASWSMRHRWIAAAVVTVVTIGGVAAYETGLLGPQLAEAPRHGSFVEPRDDGTVLAGLEANLRNEGRTPVTIEALAPPQLDGVRWHPSDQLPVTVPPGAEVPVTVAFEVDGCELDALGYDQLDVHAEGGLLPARAVTVDPVEPAAVIEPADTTVAGTSVPPWDDQPPSWLLEVLAPICADPAAVAELVETP